MGLLDKLKNVFFEDEYVEVEESDEKPKAKERVKGKDKKEKDKKEIAKRIETPKRERKEVEVVEEEDILIDDDLEQEILSDRELLKPLDKFKEFDDDDFVEEVKEEKKVNIPPIDRKEEKVPYGGAPRMDYSNLYKGEKKEKEFHPTPIISPVYGVLGNNYSKEDIVDKKEKRTVSSYARKVDLDTVRKKAYGEFTNDFDLGGNDNFTNEKIIEEELIEDNLLYDMSEHDNTPAVEKVTIADAEEYFEDLGLEYNIDYKDKSQESATGRRVRHTPVIDMDDEEDEDDLPPGEETKKKEDESLEDNLFDLIDSMYEEKE